MKLTYRPEIDSLGAIAICFLGNKIINE